MIFDKEYQLEQFREKQHEVFMDDGKVWPNVGKNSICEEMLKLINLLEEEVRNLESKKNIDILQKIYDSEINFKIESVCWDGGLSVSLKPSNPYDGNPWGITDTVYGIDNAINRLIELIAEHYPMSQFILNR